MRNFVLSNLAMDSLGPTFGYNEIIPTKPTDRYYTGILAPRDAILAEDDIPEYEESDINSDKKRTLQSIEDYQDKGVSHTAGDELSPVIDPRSYPKNMGISFSCITEEEIPEFKLAITYAKYGKNETEMWQRNPRGIVLDMKELLTTKNGSSSIIREKYYFHVVDSELGRINITSEPSIAESYLYTFVRPDRKNPEISVVTLMLVNNLEFADKKKDSDEYVQNLIFQPELRVVFERSTKFEENNMEPESEGEEYDDFRYRGREQHARGHLCSVTWGDFDHQKLDEKDLKDLLINHLPYSDSTDKESLDLSEKPPFKWIDSNHPGVSEYSEIFSNPTLRSEYLPIMVIPAPDMDPSGDGTSWRPCPSAKALSQANSADSIISEIQPLIDGYSDWISEHLVGAPQEVVEKANQALARMQIGLETLSNNDDARLAFNIANRAIFQANVWANQIRGRDREFVWRKFQLAFALSTIESVTYPDSDGRRDLDLLWVATGGGKTEAYLLVMAYSVVLRRLQSNKDENLPRWHGVDVITRYTLRLLTIQQSRRTLGMVTALEWLRNTNWHPSGSNDKKFSEQPIGLGVWVGGSLTPNHLTGNKDGKSLKDENFNYSKISSLSAIRLLKHGHTLSKSQKHKAAEPAQILSCPACNSHLSFPLNSEINESIGKISWVCRTNMSEDYLSMCSSMIDEITDCKVHQHDKLTYTLEISLIESVRDEADLDQVWKKIKKYVEENRSFINHLCFRPGRPGYFPKQIEYGSKKKTYDFEIHCPNTTCDLNQTTWSGKMPSGIRDVTKEEHLDLSSIICSDGWSMYDDRSKSRGMPIPAYTVDEQIYSRAPSIIVSTVDKFAQLSKNPRCGLIFGAALSHNSDSGYSRKRGSNKDVKLPNGLLPPNLIVQDELHLIEGPLGSMVGFYETAVDKLCSEHPFIDNYRVKYVASSATINKGEEQVECLFDRQTNLFPPKGRNWKDRGFIVENEDEKASSRGDDKGRLFVGICPIGVTGLSTQREIFASLLYHTAKCVEDDGTPSDRYWTTVGYYNAVRELAGARTLLSFEVQEAASRINQFRGHSELFESRPNEGRIIELSGRMESSLLPQMLANLESRSRNTNDATDVLLSTSMFGTGVDVDRLNLMVVAGQPKTTAQYIQSAGRVGRDKGGLIIAYLRSSRPRDLDHYERFIGYHSQINRHVEAVTVRPFAKPVLERAGGPVQIAWLRNSREVGPAFTDPTSGITADWSSDEAAHPFYPGSSITSDMKDSVEIIVRRHDTQPVDRQIIQRPHNEIRDVILMPMLDKWQHYCLESKKKGKPLQWEEKGIMPEEQDRRWTVMAGEHQVGANKSKDSAVYSEEYQAPNSLRTTDGEIQVRTRGERQR